jgi:hypothetical protein
MLTKGTEWPTATLSVAVHGKWQKRLFFHFLDLKILNSHILLKSCGSNLSQRLPTDTGEKYGRVSQTTVSPTATCRRALSFGDKNWSPWREQSPALAHTWQEDELCCVSRPYEKEAPSSNKVRKMWCWTMYIWLFQRLPRKGAALGCDNNGVKKEILTYRKHLIIGM